MKLWHGTQDAPRIPESVPAGGSVQIWIGTYPIELGQDVVVSFEVLRAGVNKRADVVPATWHHNDIDNGNSRWLVELGPFKAGDTVVYSISGAGSDGPIETETFQFSVTVPTAE